MKWLVCACLQVATRKAYGMALAKLGRYNERVVALDGDTKNSTFSEIFKNEHPNRYVECYIAEQNMVGVPLLLSYKYSLVYQKECIPSDLQLIVYISSEDKYLKTRNEGRMCSGVDLASEEVLMNPRTQFTQTESHQKVVNYCHS